MLRPVLGGLKLPGVGLLHGGGRHAHAVVLHGKAAGLRLPVHRHRDRAAAGVVADTVAHQVFQRTRQQGRVSLDGIFPSGGLQFQRIAAVQPAVEQFGEHAPRQFHRVKVAPLQRLHGVFQLRDQVQVPDQIPQPFPLGADHARLLPGRRGQRRVGGQGARVAQYDRERRAHIVGDAVDPFRPGGVPPRHLGADPVQRFLHRGQFAGLRQSRGLPGGDLADALHQRRGALLHAAGAAPEQRHHQQQVGRHDAQAAVQHCAHPAQAHQVAEAQAHQPVLIPGHHQQPAAVQYPFQHRVILQIPAAEAGDVRRRVVAAQRRRQLPGPDDTALRVQDHRPGQAAALQQCRDLRLPHAVAPTLRLHAGGQFVQRGAEGRHPVDRHAQSQQHDPVGYQKQQDQPDAGEEIPAEKPLCGHGASSSRSTISR